VNRARPLGPFPDVARCEEEKVIDPGKNWVTMRIACEETEATNSAK
jgi:hypothetical protein